jgi:hypothetical protein
MAKNPIGLDDRAKVKFRVIEFELEGANAAVENSVKNLTTVIMQKNGASAPAKPALIRGNGAGPVLRAAPTGADIPEEPENLQELVPDANEDSVESAPAKPRVARRPPVPQVIEIDLTSGEMPFAKFCEGKHLSKDTDKYLLCAVWQKEYRNTPSVTDDHIYTMFKFMKWPIQADVAAPLRSMKRTGWFTTPERGKYAVNHLGENEVNRMSAA